MRIKRILLLTLPPFDRSMLVSAMELWLEELFVKPARYNSLGYGIGRSNSTS